MSARDPELARQAAELALHIAIDGPAGAGKSTVGKHLALALDCPYVDTGLMYRAVTWLALEHGIPLDDEGEIVRLAERTRFSLGAGEELLVDGHPASPMLRSPAVDRVVSKVSAYPAVRAAMVREQRSVAGGRCVVMVGRDIGTVVLPNAPVKLWVTAPAVVRARRRLAEHLPGGAQTEQAMVRQIQERDHLDATKPISPMVPAPDAVEIDTGALTPEETVQRALQAVSSAVHRLTPSPAAPGRDLAP